MSVEQLIGVAVLLGAMLASMVVYRLSKRASLEVVGTTTRCNGSCPKCKLACDTQPREGDIAICSQGKLGKITSSRPERVTFPDGECRDVWIGTALSDEFKPWCSRQPRVLARRGDDDVYYVVGQP